MIIPVIKPYKNLRIKVDQPDSQIYAHESQSIKIVFIFSVIYFGVRVILKQPFQLK